MIKAKDLTPGTRFLAAPASDRTGPLVVDDQGDGLPGYHSKAFKTYGGPKWVWCHAEKSKIGYIFKLEDVTEVLG